MVYDLADKRKIDALGLVEQLICGNHVLKIRVVVK